MKTLSMNTQQSLLAFAHRPLKKGEIFLLANVLASTIPTPASGTENVALYTLTHRGRIDEIIYSLTQFITIDRETIEKIYAIINQLVLWKFTVAHGITTPVFSGDPNTVVDDVTGILRFVDTGDICAVSDMAMQANSVTEMFSEYVSTASGQ